MMQPTPDNIRAAREAAGHTQTEAARLVFSALRTWQNWEGGARKMPQGLFVLYLLRTGQVSLRDLPRVGEGV